MKILGIETSCDETAASIIEARGGFANPQFKILSNIISSQIDLHKKYGGIVPEVASRAHAEMILPVISEALKTLKLNNLEAIAVTVGPGLIGSLLVGVNAAKTLAYLFKKPLLAINHLEGHIYANWLEPTKITKIKFPAICLIVSGGHTLLVLMRDYLKYKILGETRDDAAGECFDKVAKILRLGYPGGPAIAASAAKLSTIDHRLSIKLPRPMINSLDFDFSFSGLKTAVLYEIKNQKSKIKNQKFIAALAKEVQEAVVEVLVAKTIKAAEKYKAKTIMICGGVAANEELRKQFKLKIKNRKLKINFLFPRKDLCTDNAAMIAAAGYFRYLKKDFVSWLKIESQANLSLSSF